MLSSGSKLLRVEYEPTKLLKISTQQLFTSFPDEADFEPYSAKELSSWLAQQQSSGFKMCPWNSQVPPLKAEEAFKVITDPEECELDLIKWSGSKGKDNMPKGPGLLTWDGEAVKQQQMENLNLLT